MAVRMPVADWNATLRILVMACLIEIAVRTTSLTRAARACGVSLSISPARDEAAHMPPLKLTPPERRGLRAVRRVMRRWRFCRGTCLRESLLAGYVLRDRRPALAIGVRKDARQLNAHAWLVVEGRTVGTSQSFHNLLTSSGHPDVPTSMAM